VPAAAVLDAITNLGQGTVTTGGTTAPVAGTSESWTISATVAFPAVSVAGGTQFRFVDPALPGEIMIGTSAPGGTGAGQSWTVTRGAEGTVPVSHTAGFTINEAVTAGFLSRLAQGQADGTGQVALVYSTAAGGTGLVAAVAAAAGSDQNSNGFAAGFTGPSVGLHPGASPAAPETWQPLGNYPSGTTVRARYRLTPAGELEIDINLTGTPAVGSANFPNTMPAAYRPAVTKRLVIAQGGTLGLATVNTTGVVGLNIGSGGSSTADVTGTVGLD
jgi:hypothetical protein